MPFFDREIDVIKHLVTAASGRISLGHIIENDHRHRLIVQAGGPVPSCKMTLRVGLDKRTVRWGQGTGIRRYRDRLRACIESHSHLFARPHLLTDSKHPNAETTQVGPRFFADARKWHTLTRRMRSVKIEGRVDLFHWSHPLPLWVEGVLNIVTIHDLIPLNQPEHSAIPSVKFRRLLKQLVERGTCFTCVSDDTRSQLIDATGIDPTRAICTWQPVDALRADARPFGGLARGSYFLLLGAVEPRKNVMRVVEAWREADTGLKLVIAGPDGHWPSRSQRAACEREMAHPDILRLPWLADDRIESLLVNCAALVMPSLAEGFGLPPVEAMSAGVPAIASASSLSEEILGDAALLVDPLDVTAIAAAIRYVGRSFGAETPMRKAGLERARRFDGPAFASRLRLAYDQFLQLGPCG
ncbi:glycosyltransferase family 4 protein [Sphingopyxis panaciterrae]